MSTSPAIEDTCMSSPATRLSRSSETNGARKIRLATCAVVRESRSALSQRTKVRPISKTPTQIAAEYSLTETQVNEALAFYEAHRAEVDAAIAAELALEEAYV